jgi:hypothetical protein
VELLCFGGGFVTSHLLSLVANASSNYLVFLYLGALRLRLNGEPYVFRFSDWIYACRSNKRVFSVTHRKCSMVWYSWGLGVIDHSIGRFVKTKHERRARTRGRIRERARPKQTPEATTRRARLRLGMVWFQTGFNGLVFLIGVSWFGE